MSPNVRLEPPEAALTGRHLAEFVQVDVEGSGMSYEEVVDLVEGMLKHVVAVVKGEAYGELEILGRDLPDCSDPFPRLTHSRAVLMLRPPASTLTRRQRFPGRG